MSLPKSSAHTALHTRPTRGNPFPLFIAVRPTQAVCFEIGDTSQAKPMAFEVGFEERLGLSPRLPVIPHRAQLQLSRRRERRPVGPRTSSLHQRQSVETAWKRASRGNRFHLHSTEPQDLIGECHRPPSSRLAKATILPLRNFQGADLQLRPTWLPTTSPVLLFLLGLLNPLKGISHG